MTELERFEKLVSSEPFCYSIKKHEHGYQSPNTELMRLMWIAGRVDAFGEAHEQLTGAGNETQTPQRI